jgi:two-component system, response regulator PdtaR
MPHLPTVLIVEDDPLILMDTAEELAGRGFTVLEAANADAAIRLLAAHPEIEVLFTDVDMPGSMDGLQLAAAVRDRWPPVAIIVTSGMRHIQLGDLPSGSRYLGKPCRAEAVVAAITELAR